MFKLKDLIDLGISTIEKLELKRKQYPKLDALYFLQPTQQNIELINQDFA